MNGCALGTAALSAINLLCCQFILLVVFHDLAGWEPIGYSCITRQAVLPLPEEKSLSICKEGRNIIEN